MRIKKVTLHKDLVKEWLYLPSEVKVVSDVDIILECDKFEDLKIEGEIPVKSLLTESMTIQETRRRVIEIGDVKFE